MRKTVLVLGMLVAALAADLRASEARTWLPFCATYADNSGITSCSFYTYEQCLASVSGIGGFCKNNPIPPDRTFQPPPPPPPVRQGPQLMFQGRPWHPFCATYQDAFGATSCAFDTYQQCQDTLGGNGGFCKNNPFPPDNPAPRPQTKRPR